MRRHRAGVEREPVDELLAWASTVGVGVEDRSLERIGRYLDLLAVWNRTTNLVGDRDRSRWMLHHVADCLRLSSVMPPELPVADVGSGAGFPGLVLACVRPAQPIVLIEPRRRRASFLRDVVRTLPLPAVEVVEARAEWLAGHEGFGQAFGCAVSRALRIGMFLDVAQPLIRPGGLLVSMQTGDVTQVDAMRHGATGLEALPTITYVLPSGAKRALVCFVRH